MEIKKVLKMSNRVYDVTKYVVQIVLPATATLYFTFSTLWGLPNGEEVVASFAALAAFLGVLLGVSNSAYKQSDAFYDGDINVETNEEGTKIFSMTINGNPEDLENMDKVTFKVNK